MGFSLTSPAPEKCDPTAKNRVWGFFGEAPETSRQNRPQYLQPRRETRLNTTKVASGRTYWPSRDPIEEMGGLNLYGMLANDALNWWDYLGLEGNNLHGGSNVNWPNKPGPNATPEEIAKWNKAVNARLVQIQIEIQNGNPRSGNSEKGSPLNPRTLPEKPTVKRPSRAQAKGGGGVILIIVDILNVLEKGQTTRAAHEAARNGLLMVELGKTKCKFEKLAIGGKKGCGCCQLDLYLKYPISPLGRKRIIKIGGSPDPAVYGAPTTIHVEARYFNKPCANRKDKHGDIRAIPGAGLWGQDWTVSKLITM